MIGPNGAGKTTVFNVITGVYEPTAGDVRFAGESHRRASATPGSPDAGIARTFQSLRLFLNMTVLENVMAATYGDTKATPLESMLRLPRARREEREVRALTEEVLSFFGERLAGYRWDQPAYSLSYANRRRLEIARALATRPEAAAARRARRRDEPQRDARGDRDDRPPARRARRWRSSSSSTTCTWWAAFSDRVVALDHGVKITEGTLRRRSPTTRRWSRPTWGATPRRWRRRDERAAQARRRHDLLRQDADPRGDHPRGRRPASWSACSAATPRGSRPR